MSYSQIYVDRDPFTGEVWFHDGKGMSGPRAQSIAELKQHLRSIYESEAKANGKAPPDSDPLFIRSMEYLDQYEMRHMTPSYSLLQPAAKIDIAELTRKNGGKTPQIIVAARFDTVEFDWNACEYRLLQPDGSVSFRSADPAQILALISATIKSRPADAAPLDLLEKMIAAVHAIERQLQNGSAHSDMVLLNRAYLLGKGPSCNEVRIDYGNGAVLTTTSKRDDNGTEIPGSGEWRFKFANGEELVTTDEVVAREKMDALMQSLNPRQRHRVIEQAKKQVAKWKREAEAANVIKASKQETEALVRAMDAGLEQLMHWQKGGLRLERLQHTQWHSLHEALKAGAVSAMWGKQSIGMDIDSPNGQGSPPGFVIEHDWAAALSRGEDFEGGQILLPYDDQIFEFKISGRYVIAIITRVRCVIFVRMDGSAGVVGKDGRPRETDAWAIPQWTYRRVADDGWDWRAEQMKPVTIHQADFDDLPVEDSVQGTDHFAPLRDMVLGEIRAVAIALDAEVATTETVRAPEKLNRKREKVGKLPIASFHVVRLARRTKASPLPEGHEKEERARMRMHFVRGHYRHYRDHKTWIKWHMRGDPDLGFIDKEYRL